MKVNDVESKVVVSKTCRGLSVSSDPEAGSHVTDSVSLPANSCRLDSIYPFKGDSFDISVKIEDFKFPALIDTGAAVAAISSQVWDKYLSHKSCCLDSSSTSRVTSVSGSPEGISPNPDKVRLVQEFPTPTNLKELRSFLGLANYYRRFVRGFSNIANPLNALTKKNVPFDCTIVLRLLTSLSVPWFLHRFWHILIFGNHFYYLLTLAPLVLVLLQHKFKMERK